MMSRLLRAERLFLLGVNITFLCAFLSIWPQLRGLYGHQGILPVTEPDFGEMHTLIAFIAPKYMSFISAMEVLALLGAVSSMLSISFNSSSLFAMLFQIACYHSIYSCGDVFMHFQWDILLLETGWLAVLVILYAKTRGADAGSETSPGLEMVKFAGFKLMFLSGVVKLTSEGPTWWGLTALHHHFQTQCIPTPLSWVAHNLSTDTMKRLGVAATFFMQIHVSFFFYGPKRAAKMAAFLHAGMQLVIALTGNYNSFNWNAAILLVPAFFSDYELPIWSLLRKFKITKILVFVVEYFGIFILAAIDWKRAVALNEEGQMVLDFTPLSLDTWLKNLLFPLGLGLFFISILGSLWHHGKRWSVYYLPALVLTYILVFGNTEKLALNNKTVWNSVSPVTRTKLPVLVDIHRGVHHVHQKYSMTSSYGLFRQMTGVRYGRPEIIVKATDFWPDPLPSTFKELHFRYKPTDVKFSGASWVAPHQPRLDWQMWFAALTGNARQIAWIWGFAFRLMAGSEDVWALMDPDMNTIFNATSSPRAISANKLYYQFTGEHVSDQIRETFRVNNNDIWWRRRSGEASDDKWLQPVNSDAYYLMTWLRENKFLGFKKLPTPKPIQQLLDQLLKIGRTYDTTVLILSAVWLAVLMRMTNNLFKIFLAPEPNSGKEPKKQTPVKSKKSSETKNSSPGSGKSSKKSKSAKKKD